MVGVQAQGQGSGAEVGADGDAAVQDYSDEARVKGAGMKWWRGLWLGVCEAVCIYIYVVAQGVRNIYGG